MSQYAFSGNTIINQSFPDTRTALNAAYAALASNSSGDNDPTSVAGGSLATVQHQWWYDSTNNKLMLRNDANNAWIEIATIDETSGNVLSITTQGLTIGATALTATGTEINQLSTITRGSILYGNASGATARLAKGSAGTVLTSDGTDISWAAAAGGGGGTEFISSMDISNAGTFDFTGFDESKYDIYKLFFSNITPATDGANFKMYSSSNAGVSYDTTSGDYSHATFFMQSGFGQFTGTLNTSNRVDLTNGIGTATGEEGGASVEITIFGTHLAQYTHFQIRSYYVTNGAKTAQVISGATRASALAVDAVRFEFSAGNIASGTFTAYGMVNS
tara:strand:+ start:356 stop:1354 length:999 start_codon:yes stop_codon:yes gene_type:complete